MSRTNGDKPLVVGESGTLSYGSLLGLLPQVVFVIDANGCWQYLSAAWRQITGFEVEATIGQSYDTYLHPDTRKEGVRLIESLLKGERRSLEGRLRFRHNAQEYCSTRIAARAIVGDDSRLLAISGTLEDTTEWQQHGFASENGTTDQRPSVAADVTKRKRAREATTQRLPDDRERLSRPVQDSLSRRHRQVSLSAAIAEEIAAATDLEEFYGRVVQQLHEAFAYYHTQLLRYDPARKVVKLVAAAGEASAELMEGGHELALAEGVVGAAAASGQPMLCANVEEDPDWSPNPLLPNTRGELAVPIVLEEQLLGVLYVQSDRENALDEDDLLILKTLASQIGTAIDSARLRETMEERLRELDNLQRLMSRDAWVRYRETRKRHAAGYLYDREALQALDANSMPGPQQNGDSAPDVRGREEQWAVPLETWGESFGILGVREDPDDPLSEEDRELLASISRQVAEALENARLLEQTQKRAVELETVSRVSATTSTILEADRLLRAVVELTKRSFNLYHAHVYLLDDERGELVLAAGSGKAGDIMVEEGWSIGTGHDQSLVARAARTRDGVIVNDVRAAGYLPNPLLPETRSELAVPIIVGRRLLGVMDVQSDVKDYFTDEDVQIQSALANQVGVALQNAILYQEQIETADQLREFDRLKSEFLASMSHELRTPLNSIIGFADVLLEEIDGPLNERMEEDVLLIRNSGEHLRALIGDILDMSKIEAGMMELRYEKIDVPEMEKNIKAFARTQLMTYERSLDFVLEIDPEIETIEVDRTRFRQVLYNLISNAIKFTNEGRVAVSMDNVDEGLQVKVEDTGIGVKEEDLPVIFEQFRQVDGSLTRTAGGSGLGLPISKSLVELHGGEIRVKSREGVGTTFIVTLPPNRAVGQRESAGPLRTLD